MKPSAVSIRVASPHSHEPSHTVTVDGGANDIYVLLPWLLEDERVRCMFRGGEGNISRHFISVGVYVVTMVRRSHQWEAGRQADA